MTVDACEVGDIVSSKVVSTGESGIREHHGDSGIGRVTNQNNKEIIERHSRSEGRRVLRRGVTHVDVVTIGIDHKSHHCRGVDGHVKNMALCGSLVSGRAAADSTEDDRVVRSRFRPLGGITEESREEGIWSGHGGRRSQSTVPVQQFTKLTIRIVVFLVLDTPKVRK